jgi:Arc/MetJ-type ribon-helix-helix transcriptional regulator
MPGQRAANQKMILIWMSDKFINAIDGAYREEGFDDRAKFIRAAVREKLERMGYTIPMADTLSPKRRDPPKPVSPSKKGAKILDKHGLPLSSELVSGIEASAEAVAKMVSNEHPEPEPSSKADVPIDDKHSPPRDIATRSKLRRPSPTPAPK